jgi:hypothetical protein
MSLVYQLQQAEKIKDKLKDKKEDAETNWKISNFVAQMSPTDKNEKNEQKAKDLYKDIDNAIKDVKDAKQDIKREQGFADQSKKLAKRFEKFLKAGKLDRAEQLMGHINKKDNIDISPYLSKNFGKIAGKSGINLSMDFSLPQDQLIAQANLTNPQKNYFDALTNPVQFLDDVKGLVDKLNQQTQQKEQMIEDLLRPGKKDQSSAAFGDLIAGVDFDDPSNWPSIKDAEDLKEIPIKYYEDMDQFAPVIPLETASLQGINFNTSFG